MMDFGRIDRVSSVLELEGMIGQEVDRHGFGNQGALRARLRLAGHQVNVAVADRLQIKLTAIRQKLVREYLSAAIRGSRFETSVRTAYARIAGRG